MASSNTITLNFQETIAAVTAALQDGAIPIIMGSPGVGKTAMMNMIAAALDLEPVQLIAREYEPYELSGVINVEGGVLSRHLIGPALAMCERPCLGMFDELTAASTPTFAQCAKILHERRFGDRMAHPKTLMMGAANPQNQSLDANDLPMPLINRLRIIQMEPRLDEVQAFFANLGEPGTRLRMAGQSIAAVWDAQPQLLQIRPDPAQVQNCPKDNQNWASPRSWERAARTLAREQELPMRILKASLEGDLGPNIADQFLAIRNTLGNLPSIREICTTPAKARLPKDFLTGVGLLSMLSALCAEDPCAAWIYCNRVSEKTTKGGDDIRIALASALGRCGAMTEKQLSDSEFEDDARQARIALGASQNKARGKV